MSVQDLVERVHQKAELFLKLSLNSALKKSLHEFARTELTYSSNAIEGNTLTRQETKLITEDGLSVGGKSIVEILEAKNHHQALLFVESLAQEKDTPNLDIQDILSIHKHILEGIKTNQAGVLRNIPVRISGSQMIPPNHMKVADMMGSLVADLQGFKGDVAQAIKLAIDAHYQLVTIHPFVDGNGRTARLLFNLILLQHKLPLASIRPMDRGKYIRGLEKAQIGGSKDDYIKIMYESIEYSLNVYLRDNNDKNIVKDEPRLYKIGELAKLIGKDNSTIRYWTKEGLLSVFKRTPSGYALYDSHALTKAKHIRLLQEEQRLTLTEIKEVLK